MSAACLKAGTYLDFHPGSSALPCNAQCCPGTGRGKGGPGALDHCSGSSQRASAARRGAGRRGDLVSGPPSHTGQAASALSLTLCSEQSLQLKEITISLKTASPCRREPIPASLPSVMASPGHTGDALDVSAVGRLRLRVAAAVAAPRVNTQAALQLPWWQCQWS